MPPFDHDCIDPTTDVVEAKMVEAVATANKRCRVGKIEPDRTEYRRFLDGEFATPEGVGMWLADRGRVQTYPATIRATLLGIAWWTSPLGQRRVRIVGRRIEPFKAARTNRFGPAGLAWPALCHLEPASVIARTFTGGSLEAVAICACGVVGPPASIGWMGGTCGPCHDHREEHGVALPDALGPTTLATGGACMHVAFSASGKTLVGASFGPESLESRAAITFWDSKTGKVRKEHEHEVYLARSDLPFAATGKRVFVEGYEQTALFDQETGKRLELGGAARNVALLTPFPDGTSLAGSEPDLGIVLRDLDAGSDWTLAFAVPGEDHDEPGTLAFSADGKLLASGRQGGQVDLHNWPGGEHRVLYPDEPVESHRANALAFSPDGSLLAAGTGTHSLLADSELEFVPDLPANGQVIIFDLKSRKQAACFPIAGANVLCLAFSLDGAFAFAGDGNGAIWVFDTEKHEAVACLAGHLGAVNGLALSPDGETLASAGREGLVRLWPWRAVLAGPGIRSQKRLSPKR